MADWKMVPKWRCWCPLPQEGNCRGYISDRDSEAECFDSMMQHLRSKREHFLHRTEAQLRGIVEDYFEEHTEHFLKWVCPKDNDYWPYADERPTKQSRGPPPPPPPIPAGASRPAAQPSGRPPPLPAASSSAASPATGSKHNKLSGDRSGNDIDVIEDS